MNNHALENEIREFALANGASVIGFSSLGDIWDDVARIWPVGDIATRNAVTVGIALNNKIVSQLLAPQEDTKERYGRECYVVVNEQLNELTAKLAIFLQEKGYPSQAIAASDRANNNPLLGTFSHKIAGRRAGLGWIGRHCMLITPQYGPAIRWGTVLTDAHFTNAELMENKCGDCRACVNICPVQAYTGKPFAEPDPLSERFDTAKCHAHLTEVKICGKCLAICMKKSEERREKREERRIDN
ncbi:MAG: 4Fe-4S binding protein [bacterium]